jgi:hypothetical protein
MPLWWGLLPVAGLPGLLAHLTSLWAKTHSLLHTSTPGLSLLPFPGKWHSLHFWFCKKSSEVCPGLFDHGIPDSSFGKEDNGEGWWADCDDQQGRGGPSTTDLLLHQPSACWECLNMAFWDKKIKCMHMYSSVSLPYCYWHKDVCMQSTNNKLW